MMRIQLTILSTLLAVALAGPVEAITRAVPAGSSLQAAIDAAQPGDVLLLEAGAVFMGPIYLRYKPGADASTDWITIRTSTPDGQFPAAGVRVTPALAPLMPKIYSPGTNLPALQTEPRAHHYRLIGLEIATVNAAAGTRELVRLGDGSSAQNSMSLVPHHLEVSRCYIHSYPDQDMIRAIALNSASTTIADSHISDIKSAGFDSQAVWGWNGPGPFDIINNYLEASGENAGFGGAPPAIPGLIATNIRFLRNHFFKPLSWKGKYIAKNLFELKMAQDVLVEGNVFENNWAGGQVGFAIVLTVRNDAAPWATIRNLVIRNNVIRNTSSGIQILGHEDDGRPSVLADNILIENNLIYGADPAANGGDGHFLKIGHVPTRLTVQRNTFHGINTSAVVLVYGDSAPGFVFRDNIVAPMRYGFHGEKAGGLAAISMYFPNSLIVNNVIAQPDAGYFTHIPANNFPILNSVVPSLFRDVASGDFRLAAGSPYVARASDGQDIGVSLTQLNASLTGVSKSPQPPKNVRILPQGH